MSESRHKLFRPGEAIFEEKQLADDLYIIQTGHVGVFRYNPKGELFPIGIVEPNHFLGEVGMSQGRYRTSTALALTHVTAVILQKAVFENQIKDVNPWIRALLTSFAQRLQKSNDILMKNGFADLDLVKRIETYKAESPALRERLEQKKAS